MCGFFCVCYLAELSQASEDLLLSVYVGVTKQLWVEEGVSM